ncbi:hypothetical protein LZC95_30120 [Pendulispora brunnea]|uniref:Acyl-protein synthetase LuxE domain-containing protein n=1 Tax=Pendulispora brunnea TaxID=2905690 RepID=A0ABZ2K0J9_9BACT
MSTEVSPPPVLEAAEAICRIDEPLHWTPRKTELMVAACRELAIYHAANNGDIRSIYERHGFDPRSIREEADIARIPPLGVTAMKSYTIHTRPASECVLNLTSSGTRGQKTQIWFDQESLDRCQAQLTGQWAQEGLVSDRPTNYLSFNYNPADAGNLGTAFADKNQQRFAPVARSYSTIRKNAAGAWESRQDDILRILSEYEQEGLPVRIFAMPAFLYETLLEMKARNLTMKLPEGSFVGTGGGWKAAEDKQISRAEFRATITERLGIPAEWIRDGYGMAEHCAPYIECKKHRLHVGAYTRVIVRDPATLAPLPNGQRGLIELVTPFNTMMPNLAILTTDLGRIDADACDCGWQSPTFTVLGRGGITKHKGCALTANEIVRRSSAS